MLQLQRFTFSVGNAAIESMFTVAVSHCNGLTFTEPSNSPADVCRLVVESQLNEVRCLVGKYGGYKPLDIDGGDSSVSGRRGFQRAEDLLRSSIDHFTNFFKEIRFGLTSVVDRLSLIHI